MNAAYRYEVYVWWAQNKTQGLGGRDKTEDIDEATYIGLGPIYSGVGSFSLPIGSWARKQPYKQQAEREGRYNIMWELL